MRNKINFMKTNKILKIVTGTAILGALCATPAAVLLSHPTTSITANSKMTINSYLADAPVDIDTVIPENSAIGNFMFQPTADGVVSRLATTFPTLDVDQIEVSNVTSSSATVTAVDYAVDYIPGSTTTVTFTIGTQVDLTTVLANDTNLNTANIFKSSNDRFADTSALLTAIKSGLAKQSNPVAFYPNEVSASFT
ncbi:hypothetical protein FACS1894166_08280 [Bacilli bacterium]|nr:hypothetical protein FACS1894166_08280 [Bacilli bacterium]